MEVKSLRACHGILRMFSHASLVTFLVQHGSGAGERVRAAGLTRAVIVKARAAVSRSPHVWRAASLHVWHSTTRALLWWSMPPFAFPYLLRQAHLGAPGWLALAVPAAYNKAVETDAQGRPRVPRSESLGRRSLLR
jgi:hypothetical protein